MFKKLIKELEQLEKLKEISVPIESDCDGFLDKECPNDECLFQFKVDENDWEKLFNDETVYCPMCRHEANSKSWFTTEQVEQAKEQAIKHIEGRIHHAIKEDARSFNASQSRHSFIKMSMKVTGVSKSQYILPVPSFEEMQLKISCKNCSANYAVVGSAFFCPCCGHNSAEETIESSLKKITDKIKNIEVIRKAVEAVSKDEAETTCRSIIETSLAECTVAFQRFCEVKYKSKEPQKKIKNNVFQNLESGSLLWFELLGESYKNWITEKEFTSLNILFQKRHLLSHTEGIVDQKYLDNTQDRMYKVGQRIIVKERDVTELVSLVKKLTSKLNELLA